MNIAFRVDAGLQIGTGHLVRCLTLADTLAQRGGRCVFLCRDLPAYLVQWVQARGHSLIPLPLHPCQQCDTELAHGNWLGASQLGDAADSLAALQGARWDWLVVDHYALDARWETLLKPAVRRILVIDDLADRRHECDVLLDQNFYTDLHTRYQGKVPQACQLLLGPRYALLREEFRLLGKTTQPRAGALRRLLVFFGGMDAQDFTGRALAVLAELALPGMQVDVVIGEQHPKRLAIEAMCQAQGYTCHVQTLAMAELMASADLAIGAGGIACWERCCLGLPTLALSTAANQTQQLKDAAGQGLLYSIEVADNLAEALKLHLQALLGNPALRRLMSVNGMTAVDGAGRLRIAEHMGCTGISIRVAEQRDAVALHSWRNHPAIRAVSNNCDEIAWADHCRWLDRVLADPQRHLLIGEVEGQPVGVVRFDVQADEAEVSIYKVPDAALPCRGADLLRCAQGWLVAQHPEVTGVHAHVKGGNMPSNGLFKAAGYDVDHTRFIRKLKRDV